jgi:hypothetical protein
MSFRHMVALRGQKCLCRMKPGKVGGAACNDGPPLARRSSSNADRHGGGGREAAARRPCGWLIIGQITPVSPPGSSGAGPRLVVRTGKTPVLDGKEWHKLIDSHPDWRACLQGDHHQLFDQVVAAVLRLGERRCAALRRQMSMMSLYRRRGRGIVPWQRVVHCMQHHRGKLRQDADPGTSAGRGLALIFTIGSSGDGRIPPTSRRR